MTTTKETAEWLRLGLLACRRERWHEGYDLLSRAARSVPQPRDLPPRAYSYLGVAMARCEGRRSEGLELCRYALTREPNEPENYANAALVYLMLGRRKVAVRLLDKGLHLAPGDAQLLQIRTEVGCRRRPALPFLARENPLNVVTGRLRHAVVTRLELHRIERAAERRAAAGH